MPKYQNGLLGLLILNNPFYMNKTRCLFFLFWVSCSTNKDSTVLVLKQDDISVNSCDKDLYRSFELKDEDFSAWISLQDDKTLEYFENLPNLTLLSSEIESVVYEEENIYLSFRILDEQALMFLGSQPEDNDYYIYKRDLIADTLQKIFDPVLLGEEYHITYFSISFDNTKAAIGIAEGSNEFSKIYIYDLVSNQLLDQSVVHSFPTGLGGVKWLPDNSGFIYTYIPEINGDHEGFMQNSQLRLCLFDSTGLSCNDVFSLHSLAEFNVNSQDYPVGYILDSKSDIILCAVASTDRYRETYWADLKDIKNGVLNWKLAWSKEDKIKSFSNRDSILYYLTAKGQENFELRSTTIPAFDFEIYEVNLPGSKMTIQEFDVVKDGIYCVRSINGVKSELLYTPFGKTSRKIDLPLAAGFLKVTSNKKLSNILLTASGWSFNESNFIYNPHQDAIDLLDKTTNSIFNEYIVEEVEIDGHDGAQIPLSIVYKSGLKMAGIAPVFMNTYGAFGYNIDPTKSPYLKSWCDRGGILAWAHVRGGGEKGALWHEQGKKNKKPNSWKDLISCSEYLIAQNFTSKEKIILNGSSAGAITVGKAITERPDLYGGAVIERGLLNTTRTEASSYGKNAVDELGSVENPEEYKALCEMDVYQSIENGHLYPPFYIIAGWEDLRAEPWMSAKTVARLQQNPKNTALLDMDHEGGHAPITYDRYLLELSRIMAFSLKVTGHPDFQE